MMELMCVNAPKKGAVVTLIKEFLEDKATFVYFKDQPLILFHGD